MIVATCERLPFVWTRDAYERAGEAGVFGDLRVELVEGEVLQMSPMKSRHAAAIGIAAKSLEAAFGVMFHAQSQMPLVLNDRSEPEPDVAIVSGRIQDYITEHPRTAELVVEISDSSLSFDRDRKARLYGTSGIPEYWIINLQDNQIEIFRKPIGKVGYSEQAVVKRGDVICPIGVSDAQLSVTELLA